jgi:hypothetical protein
MKRLRIELGRELLDIVLGDLDSSTFEAHSQRQILEPLDHRQSLKSLWGVADWSRPSTSLDGIVAYRCPPTPPPKFAPIRRTNPASPRHRAITLRSLGRLHLFNVVKGVSGVISVSAAAEPVSLQAALRPARRDSQKS